MALLIAVYSIWKRDNLAVFFLAETYEAMFNFYRVDIFANLVKVNHEQFIRDRGFVILLILHHKFQIP